MVVDFADEEKEHRAVDHRHGKIEDQQIVSFFQHQLEGVFGIRRSIHFATQERRECFPRQSHQCDIIVHHQNFFRRAVSHEWTLARKRQAFQAFPMQKNLTELAAALRERLAIIDDEESRRDLARHTERLRAVSERIERLEHQLPATIDPQLRHFLQRRSYSKALELLER
jgi:hypothetical protein